MKSHQTFNRSLSFKAHAKRAGARQTLKPTAACLIHRKQLTMDKLKKPS
jgi:hypothetical protein